MTWIALQVAMRRPELKEQFLAIVNQGVNYMSDVMSDKQYGGFHWGLSDKGETSSYCTDGKWRFIKEYQIDSQFHGVYELTGTNGKATSQDKGRIWKAAYHDGRALLNVTERLRRLARPAPGELPKGGP